MKYFAFFTLFASLVLLAAVLLPLLGIGNIRLHEVAPLLFLYALLTVGYAIASISFMRKSRRWRRSSSSTVRG